MNCATHPDVMTGVLRCSRCGVPYCSSCLVTLQGKRFCARCKGEQITDLRSGVSAEAVDLAGVGRRFAAVWIDGLIMTIPYFILMFAVVVPSVQRPGGQPPSWFGLSGFLLAPIYIIYEGVMLSQRGQTLGKMALGVKVVQPDGSDISGGQAWGRAVVRGIFISFLAIINYAPAFFTAEKTCIHDMLAKTRVVLVH